MSIRTDHTKFVAGWLVLVSLWGCSSNTTGSDDSAVSGGENAGEANRDSSAKGGGSAKGGAGSVTKGGAPTTTPATTARPSEGGDSSTNYAIGGNAPLSVGGNGQTASSSSASAAGGQSSNGSEAAAQGGRSNVVTSAAGGVVSLGGATSIGGNSAAGSSSSIGGSSATGGSSSTGGSAATGGTSSIGGNSTSAGGSATAGGTSSSIGGSATAGGSTGCVVPRGNALQFENATQPQYVSVPDSPMLHISESITIEAWVRSGVSARGAVGAIIGKPVGSAAASSFILYEAISSLSGQHSVNFDSSGTHLISAAWSFASGTWHHVALTSTPTVQQLYLDGVLVQVSTSSFVPSYDWHSMYIGTDMNSGAFGWGFKGTLDEVRIYSTARTAEQIIADMHGDCAVTTDPTLVAYYPFNESNGTVAYDASPNHLNGTLGNPAAGTGASPTWTTSSAPF